MNLLVTGGAGFIGSHVVCNLIDRPEVQTLVNLDCLTYAGQLENIRSVEQHLKYRFAKVDVRDQAAVSRVVQKHSITHVMHLAAETHVDRSIDDPGAFVHTNVVGTYHLLEACRQAWKGSNSVHRFHHVSTDEVYGSLGTEGTFSEATPFAPSSPYSASKASSNLLVGAYHKTYGLPVVLTNCSNNYGPRQFPEKLIPVIIRSVLTKQEIPIYGDGGNVRDWLYVTDHVEALWQVLNRGRNGETYCIGGQCERTNLQLAQQICDLIDEIQGSPQGQSRRLLRFVKDRPGHDYRYAIDCRKIATELGWAPCHTLDQGLRETILWFIDSFGGDEQNLVS